MPNLIRSTGQDSCRWTGQVNCRSIGIDPDKRQTLLTEGPFGRSRNPLFLAIMLGQLGFFLALPSIFSLVCLIAGIVVLVGQSYREEVTLTETFGQAYEVYRRQVPRWL